jgi:hypothetical protein
MAVTAATEPEKSSKARVSNRFLTKAATDVVAWVARVVT